MKVLSNHETGLTLPHAYEEIKGDTRKMQMRQQPETIKEQRSKRGRHAVFNNEPKPTLQSVLLISP